MDLNSIFVYGSHYWRPPNPPRERHRFHLERIKNEFGFDIVKLFIIWNWHHRGPEEFFFDEVHEIFDLCDELDLGVLLQVHLENAPYWLEQEHPEARYVSANGRAIELGAQEAMPAGGHPGLCFHHPAVGLAGERYMREIVRQFKSRRSLRAYDCWNEPHLEPAWCNNAWGNMGDRLFCYCDASRREFRQWLARRYGDIQTLNDAWPRAYTSFDQVSPPILQGNYPDWLDWFRFWHDELQQQIRQRVELIKREDPTRMVISHSGAVPPVLSRANACINNWKFAEVVDMWGTSFAPQAFSWELATCAQVMEITRSAAGGKPFWISEMAGGASNVRGFRKSRLPRAKDMHLWNWLAVAMGSRGTVHWCYLTERTGHEAGGYGLARLNGDHTPRSLAVKEIVGQLHRQQDIILGATVPTQVAVLYDPDNSSLLFAMELEDVLYGNSHIGYYRAIWRSDLAARYVTPEQLDDIPEPVLVLPMTLLLDDRVAERIAQYVKAGGTVIAEARTGLFDHRGWLREQVPAGPLAEVFGVVEGEMIASDAANAGLVPSADGTVNQKRPDDLAPIDPIHLGPPIQFDWPLQVEVAAREFLTPLALRGARPIARHGDMVLAAHHEYGKGHAYYFGTHLGFALYDNVPEAVALVREVLLQHASPPVRGNRLRPRLLRAADAALLIVFNDHAADTIEEEIVLPEGFVRATEATTGATVNTEGGRIAVTLEPESVAVYRLKK